MKVYLDHAASTPVKEEVLQEMLPFFREIFGNPSSVHTFGQDARIAVEKARRRVAASIGAEPGKIIFTSGGTESDNWALRRGALAGAGKGKHIISTRVEHPAVVNCLREMEKEGFEVSWLSSDATGSVDPEELRSLIRPDTVLVSCQYVNNELGTRMRVEELGEICRENDILFHVDAVQALGKIPLFMKELPIDLMSLSAHKIYGPKGIGALYIRKGVQLSPMILGGAQERDLRAGTESVPAIVGFGKAAELAAGCLEEERKQVEVLQNKLLEQIQDISGLHLNGPLGQADWKMQMPGYINLRLDGIEAESLMVLLDINGIAVSAGSACSSGSLEPSRVLLSTGLSAMEARESIRITLGYENTEEEMIYFASKLKECADQLRKIRSRS